MRLALHWQILIGLVLGVLAGFLVGEQVLYVEFLGTIFLRALKMIIVPLIASSIISGVIGVGSTGGLGRLGGKTFFYYVTTSLLAILTGLTLVNILKPGVGAELGLEEVPEIPEASIGTLGDTFMNMIPTNPLAAMVNGDILSIIVFCLLFGYFIIQAGDRYRTTLSNFFEGVFEVMMGLTHLVMRFSPVGVFALVAKIVATTGLAAFKPLALYSLCVLLGLMFHAGITLPLILTFVAKVNPVRHAQAMATALLTAFSTSSSAATLPITIDCVENNAGVSNRVTSFVLPLGATINMDGTALYECVAAMFIAQAYGIELSLIQQGIVVFTALLASIGAAGIPMAGLVMISIILKAIGLPLEGVGLILAVDRILDMCRTTTNVWSDSCGAVTIARTEGETEILTN